jgi:hypothetical protein
VSLSQSLSQWLLCLHSLRIKGRREISGGRHP